METIVLVISIVIALALIVLIMMQQGKGADMGASFGSGSSQTLLGSQGGGSLLTHVTAVLATGFFLTSFGLAILAKNQVDSLSDGVIAPAAIEMSDEFSGAVDLDSLDIPSLPAGINSASGKDAELPVTSDLPSVD